MVQGFMPAKRRFFDQKGVFFIENEEKNKWLFDGEQ